MFCSGSPYSPFFTSGFMLSQTDYAQDLKSFLSFDAESTCLPPALPDSPRFLPSPLPAPRANLPSLPTLARTPSTVSTRYRRVKRSDALAKLEGKLPKQPVRTLSQNTNFMSLTDDEGDDEMSCSTSSEDESDDDSFIELPPPTLRGHAHTQSSPTILSNSTLSFFSSNSRIRSIYSGPKRSMSSGRRSSSLPLQSFIDLKDEDSLRWRSFIEISVA